MTRKTGKMAVKARQLARSAKLARYKRELSQAGVSLSLPKPSKKALKEKEEELKKLYMELVPQKTEEKTEEEKSEEQAEQEQAEGAEERAEEEPLESEDDTGFEAQDQYDT
ncbi:MAG: hypothetical protein ACP5PX_05505 [Candidatus Hadarchaeum sp.]|uniref:hypothetical protein n=1 Tax=Candidatus Hadarchaeum sp. TaxID=2883567 RepID=UPI003D152255